MGKHLLAKLHNAKSNEVTESEVAELPSTGFDLTVLTILTRQGSCGITILRLQIKFLLATVGILLLSSLTDITL